MSFVSRLEKLIPSQDTLIKWQTFATILSLIAVPIVVAYVGANIQDSITSQSLKKDYVQMAVKILAEDPTKDKDDVIRKWAVDTLAEFSPVPFSESVRDKLYKAGQPWVGATLEKFAMEDMEPPPLSRLYLVPCKLMEAPLTMLAATPDNLAENMKRSEMNASRLRELQDWLNQKHTQQKAQWRMPEGYECYEVTFDFKTNP